MNLQARGTFEVTVTPVDEAGVVDGVTLGRMSLHKEFHGQLVATGKGEMLTALTGVAGSAGYVAIERVSGTLDGRQGSFVFQHTGVMSRGDQQLSISVVPDSGTGQLAGLTGVFSLDVRDGQHHYVFDYTLPE